MNPLQHIRLCQLAYSTEKLQDIESTLAQELDPSCVPELLYLEEKIKRQNGGECPLSQRVQELYKSLRVNERDASIVCLSRLSIARAAKKAHITDLSSGIQRYLADKSPETAFKAALRALISRKGELTQIIPAARLVALHEAYAGESKILSAQGLNLLRAGIQFLKGNRGDFAFETSSSTLSGQELQFLKTALLNAAKKGLCTFTLQMTTLSGTEHLLVVPYLFLAIVLGDRELAGLLIKHGLSVRSCDSQGYQPIHMAAIMADLPMIQLLIHLGADRHAKTKNGATARDLLKARGFATQGLQANLYSEDTLLAVWQRNIPPTTFDPVKELIDNNVYRQFVAIQEGAPFCSPTIVRKIERPNHPLTGEYEVLASRHIFAGEFLFEYTGTVQYTKLADSRYAMMLTDNLQVNARKGGATAAIVNHGPPNCVSIGVTYKGFPHVLMFALTDIPEGKPLYHNYHLIYFINQNIPFYELDGARVAEFVANTRQLQAFNLGDSILQILDETKEVNRPVVLRNADQKKICLEKGYTKEMILYLIEFPHQLTQMVKEGRLEAKRCQNFINFCKRMGFYQLVLSDEMDPERLARHFQDQVQLAPGGPTSNSLG